jgi:quinol monooxygenase YgiN
MGEHPVIAFVRSKVADSGRPFAIIADLTAHPGRGGEVAAAIARSGAVSLTRAESGCLAYDVCQDADSPDRFVVYELWRDLAALGFHLETTHFAAVGAALGGLLTGAPAVRVLAPVAASAEQSPAGDVLKAAHEA